MFISKAGQGAKAEIEVNIDEAKNIHAAVQKVPEIK